MTRGYVLFALLSAGLAVAGPSKKTWHKDVVFALEEIEENCRPLIQIKKINWTKVRGRFIKDVRKVKTVQDHYVLLVRLIAALEDGHAGVYPAESIKKEVKWPGEDVSAGPGLFFCRTGKKIHVKIVWSNAARSGIEPGMEVLKIDKMPAAKWLDKRMAALREYWSISTDQRAFFDACHHGPGGPAGTTLKLELRKLDGKTKKVTVTRGKASTVPVGPAVFPKGLKRIGRQSYGKLETGYGYIHLRKLKTEVVEQMDKMLAEIGEVPGLILDFRANGGGGFDHDGFLGRFIPLGKKMSRAKAYALPGAGPNPYGGPIVVIVDAGVFSAAETGSGMFKEDGRAYMIGETPTAGSSSSKMTIELPSKLFSLFVSVCSNKGRFQGGRGIEGVGIVPHEIVEYDPKDLANGVDTLIQRAEEIFKRFPQNKVAYRPHQHGWKPPR
ncbi:MAG: S41 family peptidase [Planctomycetota bacterium]|jgi:C-terminal processing protease CtpA/Prc